MIYDRTYSDIANAKRIFTEKVQKFATLTTQEQAVIDKAFFNLKALNRITEKLIEIWDNIEANSGVRINNSYVREWSRTEIFTEYSFKGIISNTKFALDQLRYMGLDVDDLYQLYFSVWNNISYSYTCLNAFEKLLQLTWERSMESYDVWSYQVDDTLYVLGAYEQEQEGTVLTIE